MGGQDKGLMVFNGETLVQRICKALEGQTAEILINANRNLDTYGTLGHRVVSDVLEDFQGPLAGVLTGMKQAKTEYLLTVPCDAPEIPTDLVSRMAETIKQGADIAIAHDGKRYQPVYALTPVRLIESLETFLQSGQRKIIIWYDEHNMVATDFSDSKTAFLNINTPGDRAELEEN